MHTNEEETCLQWREGMKICFSFKALWKVEELFLVDKKIVLTLNNFFIVDSFFDAEGSAHDPMNGTVIILEHKVWVRAFPLKWMPY